MESIASFAPPSLSRGLFGKLNNSCNGGGGGCFTANPRNCCFVLANSYSSSFLPLSYSSQNLTSTTTSLSLSLKRRSTSVIVAGKKNKNFQKKADNHSFVSKPDESTGPFPEAVLLKQKKVQEDGELLPEFADEEEKELYESLNLELESGLDVDQMRHYEVVYLIHEDYMDEVESVNLKIQDFLREKKAIVWRFSDWGIRGLAYQIKKADFAHYILMNIELGAKWINDFKNLLDKDERVIRHLVIKRDKAITEDCPPPPEFEHFQKMSTSRSKGFPYSLMKAPIPPESSEDSHDEFDDFNDPV
ncbi:hypothetical protein LguiA_031291 [Lonicera macranthoides]